jgi:cellulose synthase/poly-beta-1,6-N-acetylglucosamine synthase-like glycosyltransferase
MISIIVPSHNDEKTIQKNLESLLKQDYKGKYEIIVVDSSKDKTPDIVSQYPVKLIKQKPKGPAAARNLGVKKSKGSIIVFIDADCITPKNWLKNLLKPFSKPNVMGVAGTYKTMNKESLIARFVGYEIEQRHEKMKNFKNIDFVATFNCAYRKKIFVKLGGFNQKLTQAEDADLSFRITKKGFKIRYQPSAYVYHYHPDTLTKYLKQKFWRGYWKVFLYSKHKQKFLGDTYTPKTLLPQILLFCLFSLFFISSLFSNVFITPSIIFLVLVYFLNLDLFQFLWEQESEMVLFSLPIIFLRNLVASIGIGVGAIALFKKL